MFLNKSPIAVALAVKSWTSGDALEHTLCCIPCLPEQHRFHEENSSVLVCLSACVCTQQMHCAVLIVQTGRFLEHAAALFVPACLDFLLKEGGNDTHPDLGSMCLKCAGGSCTFWVHHSANLLQEKWDQRNTSNKLNLFLSWFKPSPGEFDGIPGEPIFNLNQNWISLTSFRSCHWIRLDWELKLYYLYADEPLVGQEPGMLLLLLYFLTIHKIMSFCPFR